MNRRILFVTLVLAIAPAGRAAEFALKDGDRVVLIGGTLIERDQSYGYLETMLTQRYPDKNITFRNLGWSGDTVWGDARGGFETAKEGFQRLKEHVHALKPTVIFVGYGMVESFDGKAGLPRFEDGLKALLDALAETKARIVLISPNAHEDMGRPFPDPAEHNANLCLYSDAIRRVAEERDLFFHDLFWFMSRSKWQDTDNGIHLTGLGYYRAFDAFEVDVRLPQLSDWSVSLDVGGAEPEIFTTRLEDIRVTRSGARFRAIDDRLPWPLPPSQKPLEGEFFDRLLSVEGLAPGRYSLKIDGEVVDLSRPPSNKKFTSATADEWANAIVLIRTPEREQVEVLRRAINAKNLLYFHRWRPQNETYLFGFRKHEQGQNAREVPLFDPLVAEKEAEIAKLKVPVSHTYELVREEEKSK